MKTQDIMEAFWVKARRMPGIAKTMQRKTSQ